MSRRARTTSSYASSSAVCLSRSTLFPPPGRRSPLTRSAGAQTVDSLLQTWRQTRSKRRTKLWHALHGLVIVATSLNVMVLSCGWRDRLSTH